MSGRREISFEVHVMQGNSWQMIARYTAAKREVAIEEAKSYGKKQGFKGTRVIRESYNPESGISEESVVYEDSPDKKSSRVKSPNKAESINSPDTATAINSPDTEYESKEGKGQRPEIQKPNKKTNYSAAPKLKKSSKANPFVKFLLGTLLCIAISAGIAFLTNTLLTGSSVGPNAKTNILSAVFVGTFIILAFVWGYASLKKSDRPAARGQKPRANQLPKMVKKKKVRRLNASKYNLKNKEDNEKEDLSLGEPEEELGEEPIEEPSGSISPHGEKQKVYLMKYLGEALAQVRASDVTLDAFNKFGINLFLAGACEILNVKRNVDPRDSSQILAEAVTLLGFKKEEAVVFSDKYQEYLLADARYMQIFQAGRNAMNTYFTEEASGLKQMAMAIQDWNKPKQKEENSGPVTVMFTDIVGSTAMTQELGDAIAQQIVRAHNRIVREALTQFAGKEIKHTGDGIMASFPVTSNGVEASIAMQRGCIAHTKENPDLPLYIKIGLNAGEPISEDNDLFGTTVQMAARIVDKAQKEEIFVSEIVQGICSGKDIKFLSRGGFQMKGYEKDPTLFEVVWAK